MTRLHCLYIVKKKIKSVQNKRGLVLEVITLQKSFEVIEA